MHERMNKKVQFYEKICSFHVIDMLYSIYNKERKRGERFEKGNKKQCKYKTGKPDSSFFTGTHIFPGLLCALYFHRYPRRYTDDSPHDASFCNSGSAKCIDTDIPAH